MQQTKSRVKESCGESTKQGYLAILLKKSGNAQLNSNTNLNQEL